MQRTLSVGICLGLLAGSALSQTQTIVDANGNSVVVAVSTDPLQGTPVTTTLSTIQPGAAVTTTAPVDPGDQQGPVQAPPQTPITGPPILTYTYTTQGAGGANQVITAVYTPTYQSANPTTPLTSGTIWGLSDYTQKYGTATGKHSSAMSLRSPGRTSLLAALCTFAGVIAGGYLVVYS